MEIPVAYQYPALPPSTIASDSDVDLEWCLFHRRIALVDSVPAVAAYSKTSNKREVAVSVRYDTPPASSCLQLYTDDEVFTKPTIVAADDNLLLIHMVVAVEDMPTLSYPQNFFVYRANRDWPCLWSLPPPCDWRANCNDTGIVRSGDDFVVANFDNSIDFDETTTSEVEVGIFRIYRSTTRRWEVKEFNMPYDEDKGLVPYEWQSDAVFSFHGCICWADYHRGILYCDFFSSEPQCSFLPFPGIGMWWGDRGNPARYRSVSICNGHLKFVNIDIGQFRGNGNERSIRDDDKGWGSQNNECNHSNQCSCHIKTWTLKMPQYMWDEGTTFQLTDFWSHSEYLKSHLPRTVPTFPIVNMQESDVLHFIVKEGKFYDKTWVINVYMKEKSVMSCKLYQNPVVDGCGIDLTHVFLTQQ